MKKCLLLTLPLMLGMNSPPQEKPQFELGQLTFAGTGCVANGTVVSLSPDQSEVQMSFFDFAGAVDGAAQKMVDRKTCNMALPFKAAPGFRVGIDPFEFRGESRMDAGVIIKMTAEHFIAGTERPKLEATFDIQGQLNFLGTGQVEPFWSECGASGIARLNLSMMIYAKDQLRGESRISDGVPFRFKTRRCE